MARVRIGFGALGWLPKLVAFSMGGRIPKLAFIGWKSFKVAWGHIMAQQREHGRLWRSKVFWFLCKRAGVDTG